MITMPYVLLIVTEHGRLPIAQFHAFRDLWIFVEAWRRAEPEGLAQIAHPEGITVLDPGAPYPTFTSAG